MARIPHFDSLDTASQDFFFFLRVSVRMIEWSEVLSALVIFIIEADRTD